VEQGDGTKQKKIQTGDFLGFPAGTKNGHALKSGDSELVYLVGGSRKMLDIAHYPDKGQRLVIDRTGPVSSWVVEEKDVKESAFVAKK